MRPPRVSLMRDRWAAGALVLVLAAGLAACGGDTEPEEPEATAVVVLDEELSALATEFIDQLVAGDFEAAAASFDDTMADALPAADLAATWQQITDQVGAYQGEITRRQEVVDVYEAVIVTAQFEQTPLDIRIVFDTDRRIAGLFFQAASATGEPTAEAWAPPSYAGDVEDREVVVGEFDLPGTLTTPGGDGQANLPTGGASLLQARTVNEVVKAQTNKVRLARLKGELVDRNQAIAHVFKLARFERDAWLNWPARISAQMAAKLGIDPHTMHVALEAAVREHLQELGDLRPRVD